jgi:hypothetical protein
MPKPVLNCAMAVEKAISQYHGVISVNAGVLYEHTKIDHHLKGCTCHHCSPEKCLDCGNPILRIDDRFSTTCDEHAGKYHKICWGMVCGRNEAKTALEVNN